MGTWLKVLAPLVIVLGVVANVAVDQLGIGGSDPQPSPIIVIGDEPTKDTVLGLDHQEGRVGTDPVASTATNPANLTPEVAVEPAPEAPAPQSINIYGQGVECSDELRASIDNSYQADVNAENIRHENKLDSLAAEASANGMLYSGWYIEQVATENEWHEMHLETLLFHYQRDLDQNAC